ncbi:thiol-disulfide oxidoreductase DCC family protein [Algibacillus agarilyticus]|uniref:thiol-disulfide oxidoreductase DCC family protein n=1 Tax=Algibacillus agarilyticus TaxID=2234133 RepID=UPI000DD0927B|nr:DUF393 domain-containing protein [Algibacillus agarilyticus]
MYQGENLNIFYDGQCPLCVTEMAHLKRHDSNNVISLIDIHQDDFARLYPKVKYDEAMRILQGEYQGRMLLGLAVTHRAWTLVGKGFWVAPLDWPIIKPISHLIYLGMAKYRHPISALAAAVFKIKISKCGSGVCYDKPKGVNNRRK